MSKDSKKYFFFTFQNEVLLTIWFDETTDGLAYGPVISGTDIHQTIFHKDSKLRTHVKHSNLDSPPDSSPLGRVISDRLLAQQVLEKYKKRVVHYHGNEKCYVFPEERWKRMQEFLPRTDDTGNIFLPIEATIANVILDFDEEVHWSKIRIRELFTYPPHFGFKFLKRGFRLIVPLTQNEILAFPLSKVTEIHDLVLNSLGMQDFFEYIFSTEEGKKWIEDIKNEVEKRIEESESAKSG